MKVLLLGHRGYLGSYLFKNIKTDVLDTTQRTLSPTNKKYDYVINCIGKPDLLYCETHVEETNYSNWLVIKDIKNYYPNAKIINFSSYYVYNDIGFCTESSKITKRYNYCRQKILGESEIEYGVSFRIGKLFGNPYANQKKLTEYIIENKNITLDTVIFNPTSVNQVLKVINYELKHNKLFGIYNLGNLGNVSHYDYGVFIDNVLPSHKTINKIKKIRRNFSNYGKCTMSLNSINNIMPLTPWQDDMKNYLNELLTIQTL